MDLDGLRDGGYLDMPIAEAAQALGVGLSTLKNCAHDVGITRWPFRSRQSLRVIIEQTTQYIKDNKLGVQGSEQEQQLLDALHAELQDVGTGRTPCLSSTIKRYRQWIFKLNHLQKKEPRMQLRFCPCVRFAAVVGGELPGIGGTSGGSCRADYVTVKLANATLPYYGNNHTAFHIHKDGYVFFNESDALAPLACLQMAKFFNADRITALCTDFNSSTTDNAPPALPPPGAHPALRDLRGHQGAKGCFTNAPMIVQAQLFFDGTITLAWDKGTPCQAAVGLSNGKLATLTEDMSTFVCSSPPPPFPPPPPAPLPAGCFYNAAGSPSGAYGLDNSIGYGSYTCMGPELVTLQTPLPPVFLFEGHTTSTYQGLVVANGASGFTNTPSSPNGPGAYGTSTSGYGGSQSTSGSYGGYSAAGQGSTLALCAAPMARGLCSSSWQRWFFDGASGSCKQFTFSGCAGNMNNFESRAACLNACQLPNSGPLPLPPAAGSGSTADLTYSTSSASAWLSGTGKGKVGPGAVEVENLRFDASKLQPGRYSAPVSLATNDRRNSLQSLEADLYYFCGRVAPQPTATQLATSLNITQLSQSPPASWTAAEVDPSDLADLQAALKQLHGITWAYFELEVTVNSAVVDLLPSNIVGSADPGILSILPNPKYGPMCSAWVVRGVMPLSDFWETTNTTVSLTVAGLQTYTGADVPAAVATREIDHWPICTLYAVDMAFNGDTGLVTDKSSAELVLACSEQLRGLCTDCVTANGTAGAAGAPYVKYINQVEGSINYYHIVVAWQRGVYYGPVTVEVDCGATDSKGNKMASLDPLHFAVARDALMRASAYKLVKAPVMGAVPTRLMTPTDPTMPSMAMAPGPSAAGAMPLGLMA
ncbi:hypothetical protein WJX72_005154 [[Myrmecia] bisecta]|uniref:RWP-RK domain-containing protein n=1 Tax=[Myrmecia] bisecta TaxID=41462 RepID=A0AAW1Q3Z3_9CHLO